MKAKIAKFGIFNTTENGADYLVTARDSKGKPLASYQSAQARLNDYPERHKMLIRSL
jgi:hypothetical protein